MIYYLNPKKVLVLLLSCVGILVVLNILSIWAMGHLPQELAQSAHIGHSYDYKTKLLHYFTLLFNLDKENNVPTLFSFLLFFTCGILLNLIGRVKKQSHQAHWKFLSLVFFYLSADEIFEIHEKMIGPLRVLNVPLAGW